MALKKRLYLTLLSHTCSWEKKVDKEFSQSKNKIIPDTKINKKFTKKKTKKDKKERHDDKTSTNDRFEINPTVIIFYEFNPAHYVKNPS